MSTLNAENLKQADEIRNLAQINNALFTEDESNELLHHQESSDEETTPPLQPKTILTAGGLARPRGNGMQPLNSFDSTTPSASGAHASLSLTPAHAFPRNTLQAVSPTENEPLSHATELIRTVEVLNGQDDVGVHDFINTVKRAKIRCSQPGLLLDYILTEKIVGNAKRAIRHCPISSYDDLYNALKTNLGTTTTLETCRSKLESIRQNQDSVQFYNQKFRSAYNELIYTIQSEYSSGIERKLALQMEEKSATKRYVMNLRDEISHQVRPLKPRTLNQALQEALEAEVWCKERLRVKVSTTHRPSPSSLRPPTGNRPATVTRIPQSQMRNQPYDSANHGLPLQLRTQMTCNFCKKMGHL